MPSLSGATGVHLYVHNRRAKTLDQVPGPSDPEPVSVAVDAPLGGVAAAACVCFRNRALLNIPDTRRSPFIAKSARTTELSRSVMFVPMFAQNELLGVLQVDHSGSIRYFTHEEQAATQHLANQVATSLKLQEQQSMREQLFRSEKLAATGQLISGIASELRAPLEAIRKLASTLQARNADAAQERDLRVLTAESQRASDIVGRLVSFGRATGTDAKLVEINELLAGLMRFRAREWDALGLEAQTLMAREPLYVMGARGQLEEVFLNLLVHAEQSVLDASQKAIMVASGILASNVLVEIGYTARPAEPGGTDPLGGEDTTSSGMVLEVCRGIVQSHGGEIRFVRTEASRAQFQVELPMARRPREGTPARPSEQRRAQRQLTILVVEPDIAVQRQLVNLLGASGHRVVPIVTADEGVEMAQRLRFDVVFCATGLPGLNWVEFFERIRSGLGAFVLMTEGFDSDLSEAIPADEGLVLPKPLQETEVVQVMEQLEARLDAAPVKPSR
jgi:signal transduction histidine kinase